MELDKALSNMLDAIESGNAWDTEAYAQQALDYIENPDNKINEKIDRDDLIIRLNSIVSFANKNNARARAKTDLIDDVLSHLGSRIYIPKRLK